MKSIAIILTALAFVQPAFSQNEIDPRDMGVLTAPLPLLKAIDAISNRTISHLENSKQLIEGDAPVREICGELSAAQASSDSALAAAYIDQNLYNRVIGFGFELFAIYTLCNTNTVIENQV